MKEVVKNKRIRSLLLKMNFIQSEETFKINPSKEEDVVLKLNLKQTENEPLPVG